MMLFYYYQKEQDTLEIVTVRQLQEKLFDYTELSITVEWYHLSNILCIPCGTMPRQTWIIAGRR